jgi:hypothetical protein
VPQQPVAATAPAPNQAPAPDATPPTPAKLSAAELEKLVAPIALYPDPLLASVLPAAAYPVEIVMAARFVKDPNNLAKLDEQPWDPNVKTVARFPEVIQKMSDNLSWTSDLGQAFIAQQQDVMKAVQTMRGRAQASGALKSTPEQTVTTDPDVVAQTNGPTVLYVTNQVVQIQPAQPDVVYVPQYNPAVVYTAAPPYYYDSYVPFITFGLGVWFGSAFWGHCYWHGGCVGYPYYPYYPYHGYYCWHGGYPYYGGHYPYHGWNTWGHATAPAATAGAMATSGSAGTPANMAHNSAMTPWHADPNRLRAAGTAGSQAALNAQNPTAASASATRSAATPAINRTTGTRSSVATHPTAAATPSAFTPGTRTANTPAWSVNRTTSTTAWTRQSQTTSQAGGRQTTVTTIQRPGVAGASRNSPWTGQTVSRSSVSPGFARSSGSSPTLSSAANYSRPAPSASSPWTAPAYNRAAMSRGPSQVGGGMRSFSAPAAPSFNYSAGRAMSAAPAMSSGGVKAAASHLSGLGKVAFRGGH